MLGIGLRNNQCGFGGIVRGQIAASWGLVKAVDFIPRVKRSWGGWYVKQFHQKILLDTMWKKIRTRAGTEKPHR